MVTPSGSPIFLDHFPFFPHNFVQFLLKLKFFYKSSMGTAPISQSNPNHLQTFNSQQDIQNQQPFDNLSDRLQKQHHRPILASRNLMALNQSKESRGKQVMKLGLGDLWRGDDGRKMTNSLQRQILLPVFEQFSRMKVKRPVFTMIQIDPRKFLKIKETLITDDYEFLNEIGKGSFGSVFKSLKKNSNEIRAIKKINKSTLQQEEKQNLVNEFDILCRLDHPNIIKLYDIYDDNENLYVVTELCQGGNLLHFVNETRLTEKMMREIMTQLLNAVRYMHSFRIIHRDIKLENIVLLKKVRGEEETIEIKLIDFGISVDLNKIQDPFTIDPMGTLLYMAPQNFQDNIGLHCDIWSCGIALYMMSTRKTPYNNSKEENNLQALVENGEIVRKNLQKLTLNLKLLIIQLLEKNPSTRITAEKAIYSPWLNNPIPKPKITCSRRLKAAKDLLDYDAKNNLVSIIESFLIYKKINQQQRQRLATIFSQIDEDKSGIIDIQELKRFYSSDSEFYDEGEVEELLSIIDKNKSGKIDFNEFIAAMYDRRELFQLQSLEEAFDFLDKDKSGEISREELQSILQGVQREEIQYLFEVLDKNNDYKICKKEFLAYLSKHE